MEIRDCLIIGGGITGLIAGNNLKKRGMTTTIIDKGRGIGGRLATRRFSHPDCGEGIFDYGAPYFSVSSEIGQELVKEWQKLEIIKTWFKQDQVNFYCGRESNRAIAKYLAKNLNVHTSTRVTQIQWKTDHWEAQTQENKTFAGKTILLTPPLPQTLELLANSKIALPEPQQTKLAEITYHPCIAVLALLAKPNQIPTPGSLSLDDSPLARLSCNQQKGISPDAVAVTMYADSNYSQNNWETEDETIVNELTEIASNWLSSPIISYQVHRWRYSQPKTVYGEPYFAIAEPGILVIAGDAFVAPQLEGAILSGMAAAEYLVLNFFSN
jgi:renalase